MAVPSHFGTERGTRLNKIRSSVSFSQLLAWPGITEQDAVFIARIITEFSYIDMIMTTLVSNIDRFDQTDLQAKWRGKTEKMRIEDIEGALRVSKWLGPNGSKAIDKIAELRQVRNLFAHFVIRRFPTEDAFVFITKSDRTFKTVLGRDPVPGSILASVLDAKYLGLVATDVTQMTEIFCDVVTEIEPVLMKLNADGQ